ncbi:MAG: putative ABC transport system substrate-binding protein [Halieaceae bacterium]
MPHSLRQTISIALLILAGGFTSFASHANTLVVLSAGGGVYIEILSELTKRSVLNPGQYHFVALSDSETLPSLPDATTGIITIGTRAAQAVYQLQPAVPVLSALITESGFAHLANTHYASLDEAHQQGVSAIYLDQPLRRLYRLGVLALPNSKRVGVLSSDISLTADKSLTTADSTRDIEIDFTVVSGDARPINLLGPIIKNSDFVIVLPGKKSINVSAARWILQFGSQTRTPVIAYSKRYVASGALAAVYTSPANVAEQIQSVLAAPRPVHGARGRTYQPETFSIEINPTVAKALGVPLSEKSFYHDEIQRMEGAE